MVAPSPLMCPLCCQPTPAGEHVCAVADETRSDICSPTTPHSVTFSGELDEQEAVDEGVPSLAEWAPGLRVVTRVALAGADKVEVPEGAKGRVWAVDEEEGLIVVFLDFPETTMKGQVVRAEPSDLLAEGFLGAGTKIISLPMFCNQLGKERQMERGATGTVTEYLPLVEKYLVWFDDGFEARVPLQLLQPRQGAKVRLTAVPKATKPVSRLASAKSAFAKVLGKLRRSPEALDDTASEGSSAPSLLSVASTRSCLKDKSRLLGQSFSSQSSDSSESPALSASRRSPRLSGRALSLVEQVRV